MSTSIIRCILAAIILGFGLTVFSCHKDDNAVAVADTNLPIMPLKLGDRWIFTVEVLDTGGTILFSGNDTSAIAGIDTIAGRHLYVVGHYFRSGLFLKSDGLYTFDVPSQKNVYLFKWPAVVGERFVSFVNGIPMVVTATNVGVTTPAGAFVCVQYDDLYSTYYFSPGVGLVAYASKPIHRRLTLQSYTLL